MDIPDLLLVTEATKTGTHSQGVADRLEYTGVQTDSEWEKDLESDVAEGDFSQRQLHPLTRVVVAVLRLLLLSGVLVLFGIFYGFCTSTVGFIMAVVLLQLLQVVHPSGLAHLPPLTIEPGDVWYYQRDGLLGAAVLGIFLALYLTLSAIALRVYQDRNRAAHRLSRTAAASNLNPHWHTWAHAWSAAVSVAHNILIIICESMMIPIGSWVVTSWSGGTDSVSVNIWFAVTVNVLGVAWRWGYRLMRSRKVEDMPSQADETDREVAAETIPGVSVV